METNFKFNIGEEVQYKGHPGIKFLIVERLHQECYAAQQNHYEVRQIISSRGNGISMALLRLIENEIEPIAKKE